MPAVIGALTKRGRCQPREMDPGRRGRGSQAGHPQRWLCHPTRSMRPLIISGKCLLLSILIAALIPHWDTQEPPNWAPCLPPAPTNRCPKSSSEDLLNADPLLSGSEANSAASRRGEVTWRNEASMGCTSPQCSPERTFDADQGQPRAGDSTESPRPGPWLLTTSKAGPRWAGWCRAGSRRLCALAAGGRESG